MWVILLFSCQKPDPKDEPHYTPEDYALISEFLTLPETPFRYNIEVPEHLSYFELTPLPVDNDLATLGRVLFYDKSLSSTGKVSCATCHQQQFAFGDDAAFSLGVEDRISKRNTIALGSEVCYSVPYENAYNPRGTRFFWDNRAGTAKEQIHEAFSNPDVMNMSPEQMAAAIQAQPFYRPLFEEAYTSGIIINEATIMFSLQEFVNALVTTDSRFDRAWANTYNGGSQLTLFDPFPDFSVQENLGKAIYLTHCVDCHGETAANPHLKAASNGLDVQPVDPGVGGITLNEEDMGLFRVPSLRNIALTSPYMHDGRFDSLEDVIEHYSTGIESHDNLHPLLRDADDNPKRFYFTPAEKEALKAFFYTLTDEAFLTAEKYADPFK